MKIMILFSLVFTQLFATVENERPVPPNIEKQKAWLKKHRKRAPAGPIEGKKKTLMGLRVSQNDLNEIAKSTDQYVHKFRHQPVNPIGDDIILDERVGQ